MAYKNDKISIDSNGTTVVFVDFDEDNQNYVLDSKTTIQLIQTLDGSKVANVIHDAPDNQKAADNYSLYFPQSSGADDDIRYETCATDHDNYYVSSRSELSTHNKEWKPVNSGQIIERKIRRRAQRNAGDDDLRYQCEHCSVVFTSSFVLQKHLQSHDNLRKHVCKYCEKGFNHQGSLTYHLRTHTGFKPYVCNVCSQAFARSSGLEIHLRKHTGDKPYKCEYCGRQFAHPDVHKRHVRTHTGERPFQCGVCLKRFSQKNDCTKHTAVCKAFTTSASTLDYEEQAIPSFMSHPYLPQEITEAQLNEAGASTSQGKYVPIETGINLSDAQFTVEEIDYHQTAATRPTTGSRRSSILARRKLQRAILPKRSPAPHQTKSQTFLLPYEHTAPPTFAPSLVQGLSADFDSAQLEQVHPPAQLPDNVFASDRLCRNSIILEAV